MKKIILFLLLFSSCGYNDDPANECRFFGWKPDGSGIVAAIVNFDNNSTSPKEIILLDKQGVKVSDLTLAKAIVSKDFTDKLYFADDGVSFYAQIANDIYMVNSETASESLLLNDQQFLTASPSGKLIFTYQFVGNDSVQYQINSVINGSVNKISSLRISNSKSFSPYFGFPRLQFLNDSGFVGCYADNGVCKLSVFDTAFKVLYQIDQETFLLPNIATSAGKVFFISNSFFSSLDMVTKKVEHITDAPFTVNSVHVVSDANTLIYTITENSSNFFNPSSLFLYDVTNKNLKSIAKGIASSAQLSPDGKKIAYCTIENKKVNFHVIQIP